MIENNPPNQHPTQLSIATADQLPWIYDLQRKFARALGWIPKEAMAEPIAQQRIILARENNEPAGFLFHKALNGEPHIHTIVQAAVAMDAQRRHHGLAALTALEQAATEDILQCWCAEELDSNAFWHQAGFQPIALRDPNNARGRRLILWRKPLTDAGKLVMMNAPLRAGPQAARPKNMVMLEADQSATLKRATPEELQDALAKIKITHSETSVRMTVEALIAAYTATRDNPRLAHMAPDIATELAEELARVDALRRQERRQTPRRPTRRNRRLDVAGEE